MTWPVNRRPFLIVRKFLKALLILPARWRWGFEVVGRQRRPRARRPQILACNHAALIDTVFLILALEPRFTVCGAKSPYFRTASRRLVMAIANILPVDGRERFIEDCRRLLAGGEILLIYPEMGRNPDGLGEFSTWAAEVAIASDAPILPCYLEGTNRGHRATSRGRQRVRLIVGREFEPEGAAAAITARLRQAIVALAPEPTGEAAA
jgi:1-acyl-sn-glycerol-3-phosphate acyltransferase